VRTLFQVLLDYDLPMLRAIAWHWDHVLAAPKAREASEELAAALLRPQRPCARNCRKWRAPRSASRRRRAYATDLFFRRFGALRGRPRALARGALAHARQRRRAPVARVIARLRPRAPGPRFVFVRAICAACCPRRNCPSPIRPAIAPPPPETQRALTFDDVTTLSRTCRSTAPSADPPKSPRAWRAPADPDPVRLALACLAQTAGLAAPYEELGSPPRLRPSGTRRWMEAARGGLRALVSWRDDPPERPAPRPTSVRGHRLATTPCARSALLRHSPPCPPARGGRCPRSPPSKNAIPTSRATNTSWYIRRSGGERSDFLLGTVGQVEGALIAFVLQSPLHWLDGRPRPARCASPRAGRPCAATPDEEAEDAALAACARTRPQSRPRRAYDLPTRTGERLRAGESYVYRLAPDSLERARAQGITLERLVEFLRRASGAPVPAPVTDALRRWAAQGVEVTLHDAVVLRVSEPALLEQLLNIPRVARLIVEPLGSRAALVKRTDAERLAAMIREMGYLVHLE
jgi:hypothetical protein